jgi:hypothetical protein
MSEERLESHMAANMAAVLEKIARRSSLRVIKGQRVRKSGFRRSHNFPFSEAIRMPWDDPRLATGEGPWDVK